MSGLPESLAEYMDSLPERDRRRYQALMQGNAELRAELEGISTSITDIMAKKRAAAKPAGRPPGERRDADLSRKKQAMSDQQQTIAALKAEIKARKVELEKTYNFEVIREKQDELNDLKRIVDELRAEKQTLEKVRKDQDRYLSEKRASSQDLGKRQELMDKIREAKEQGKALQEERYGLEKEVNAIHTLVVGKNLALKAAQQRNEREGKGSQGSCGEVSDETALRETEAKIAELKKRKEGLEADGEELIKTLEKEKKDLERRLQEMDEVAREREREMRLNAMKMKEARKEAGGKMQPKNRSVARKNEKENVANASRVARPAQSKEVRKIPSVAKKGTGKNK